MPRTTPQERSRRVVSFKGCAEHEELPVIDRKATLSARGRKRFWKLFNRFLHA